MFCGNCGAKLSDGTKFCTNCGAPVTSPTQDKNDHAEGDETVVMPSPSTSPDPAHEPVASPEPAVPSYATSASRRTGGTSPVTVAMALVAVVAVIALVVVVADPFGSRGANAPASDQQVVTEEPEDDSSDAAADDTGEVDGAEDADADADTEAAEQDAPDDAAESDDTSRGGDNNVVVVVGDDKPSRPTGDIVVHESPDGYVLPDSSSYTYSAGELSYLSDWELYLARNEIYARHGRRFNNDDLQRYFNAQSWYTPLYSPEDFDARSGSILNDVERDNAATILSLEQSRGSAYI